MINIDDVPLLEITFHWPHNRLALGWQLLRPSHDEDYTSLEVFLLICSIQINY